MNPGPQADRMLLAHMRDCLGVDLGAVWLVVEQDLPSLAEAVDRMSARLGPQG